MLVWSHIMFSDTLPSVCTGKQMRLSAACICNLKKLITPGTFGVEVVDKQSNAIEGKHYRILNNTVTIKAGEMVGNVEGSGYLMITSAVRLIRRLHPETGDSGRSI